jgi:hypothetical protein
MSTASIEGGHEGSGVYLGKGEVEDKVKGVVFGTVDDQVHNGPNGCHETSLDGCTDELRDQVVGLVHAGLVALEVPAEGDGNKDIAQHGTGEPWDDHALELDEFEEGRDNGDGDGDTDTAN